jgi:hypothetical protein
MPSIVTVPSPSDTRCTFTEDGTSRAIALSTAVAVDVRTESGSATPPRVTESTRTATRPALAYGAPVITNCTAPKKTTFAVAVRRTPLVVVLTTGSRTVTPFTVCGNEDAAAFVSSASVTVSVNAEDGVLVAVGLTDGLGVIERVGDALRTATVAVGDGKTTRDGTQSRVSRKATTIPAARNATRAADLTRYASRRRSCPSQSQ